MKFSNAFQLLLLVKSAEAFAPTQFGGRKSTIRSLGLDPSVLHDVPNQVMSLQDALSSISLSDATDALSSIPEPAAVVDAVQQAADPAAVAEASDNGWFGFLTGPIEGLLQLIHSSLVGVGLSSDAWGIAIIAMTIIIKLVTFPLTKTQLESTNKMQALQPAIKEIQAKYQSNPEVMNQKIAEMYQTNQVNPLAGCLPSLVQIPVFIGLYRAVLELAKNNKLDEPFLWLPNLEGPTYGADPTHGSDWLFSGWVNGAPSLGWDDTVSFLILPVFLVISQFVSMELMTPKDSQQQGNAVLKVLPLLIGWFSLNVPAALCVYWVTNNIVTTATSVLIRNSMKMEPVAATGSAATSSPPEASVFTPPPMREKPAGFGAGSPDSDGMTPITAIDAEIIENVSDEAPSTLEVITDEPQQKKRGGKKKKKRRKN